MKETTLKEDINKECISNIHELESLLSQIRQLIESDSLFVDTVLSLSGKIKKYHHNLINKIIRTKLLK